MSHRPVALEGSPFRAGDFLGLWVGAALTFGAGDVFTTLLVYSSPSLVEANPVVAAVVSASGGAGLVGAKLAGFAVCLGISLYAVRVHDRFLFYFPPTTLTAVGTFLTVHNGRLLLG